MNRYYIFYCKLVPHVALLTNRDFSFVNTSCHLIKHFILDIPIGQMYFLARMTDTVRLDPSCFGRGHQEAIAQVLNSKLANKVVLGVGLCVCLFDFEKILEPFVIPGDGASHSKIQFRYVVFRPFVDEVIQARIKVRLD